MLRISPYDGQQYSFNGCREIAASEFFVPASEISDTSNYRAREIAQLAVTPEADRE